MSFTPVVTDTFTRANTSVGGAGTTTGAGNGWIDAAGGVWSINSNTLLGTTTNTSGYLTQYLLRPIGEAALAQEIITNYTATASGTTRAVIGSVLRWQSAGNCYLAGAYTEDQNLSAAITIYAEVGNTATPIGTSAAFSNVSGNAYTLTFSATGVSPTTLTAVVTNITTSTVVCTFSVTDSSTALQTAGQSGLVTWGNATVNYTGAQTLNQASSGPISISPTSVAGGSINQTITVSGTATAFSGSPFTLSGGLGAVINSQTVTSTTLATININAGLAGNGAITIHDTIDVGTAALSVSPPSLGALKIGWVGDSLTQGLSGVDPISQAITYLTNFGYTVTSVNRGVGGMSTADWLPGGSLLAPALAAFAAAGITVVHLMLGTNDVRAPNNFSPTVHHANMTAIVNAIVAAGYQVIISKPPFTWPNAGTSPNQWPNDPNAIYQQYFALDMQLANGLSVFQGDTGAFEYALLNPVAFSADGIHPQNTAQWNILGNYWGVAITQRFGNALVNPWVHF